MIGSTLGHNKELHSIIIEVMINGKHKRGRLRMFYISQIIKDARIDSYKYLKNEAQDRE